MNQKVSKCNYYMCVAFRNFLCYDKEKLKGRVR